ncbi:MAG: major royal jelly family protein [Acetobacter indonesiensis]|nr:major royal jelly family protein [Acetobacter indonesiensis]MCI1546091.1 major royal jelly family protein [Acetobacter indonesiensis]MCI1765537.1 major royal jelly family protein [Acetobacter indonesiensis]
MTSVLLAESAPTMPRSSHLRAMLKAGAAVLTLAAGMAFATESRAEDTTVQGWNTTGNVTVVDCFADVQASGIARLPDGRIVLSLPTSAQRHKGPVLVAWTTGHLTPFPSVAAQGKIISPLGMTVDANGQLWLLDEGTKAGSKAKAKPALLHIDPQTNKIIRRYALTAPAVRDDSHVNDVRVDLTHGSAGTAFITDTSQTTHPALIVVDLASGQARRILADTVSVSPVPGFVMEADGRLGRYDAQHPTVPQGGVDGVALSKDSTKLYWSPLSSRRLYSAPTSVLADAGATEENLEAAVKDEGEVGIMDGMATAPDGSLYVTDIERHAIVRRAEDGSLSVVAQDARLIAPDSMAFDGESILLTVGQWARLPVFHDGKDKQQRPYILVRITPLQPVMQ